MFDDEYIMTILYVLLCLIAALCAALSVIGDFKECAILFIAFLLFTSIKGRTSED